MKRMILRFTTVLCMGLLLVATLVSPGIAQTSTTQEGISHVATAAKPSVVGILTTLKAVRSTDRGRAAGTGFVYKDGVIITNAHVVDRASEVKVLFHDKTIETVTPDRIFADETSDVAIIKVKKLGLKPLPFADSSALTVGQTVIAVGNPLGFRLGNSVTAGILSGTGRAIGSGYPFLQTDAPINPGNSGGPLFNLKGEVIGINSAKMADIGLEGLGFAIPSNTAKEISERLIRDGKVERPIMGMTFDEGWEAYFGVPNLEGVTIAGIIDDGPAGVTAFRPGDKLVKLNDTPIYTTDDVFSFLLDKSPGDKVSVTVKRSGQVLSATIILASKDALRKEAEEEGDEIGGILIGLTAGQIQEAAEFGRNLARGFGDVNHDYFAISGSNYAVLYTEYLYVARRIASAYQFGFIPGVGFQQSIAKDINSKVEVQMEIHGEKPNFLSDATYTLEQGSTKKSGTLDGSVTYTTSPDGSVVVANLAVRFETKDLDSTDNISITARTKDGKAVVFRFEIKELR